MAGIKISSATEVTTTSGIGDYKIPCAAPASAGDQSPKAIKVDTMLAVCKRVLGISEIEEFSTTKQYVAGKAGDGYCIYNEKLYRFTSAHLGAWSDSDVVETSLYNELLNFYSQTFEAVTVNVSVADEGFSVSGIEVGVKYDDGTTFTYTTDGDGNVTFNVEKGINYTVSVSGHDGYLKMSDHKYCANGNSRNVYLVYNPTSSESTQETVYLYSADNNGNKTFLADSVITVTYGGSSYTYTFDGAKWTFTVPHGVDYTITMPSVSKYKLLDVTNTTFSSSLTTRYVYGGNYWYAGDDTVILVTEDGSEYTVASFDTSLASSVKFIHIATDVLLAKDSTRVSGAKCDFYLKVGDSYPSKKWRASDTRFNSLSASTDSNWAKADYDGYANTAAIKSELEGLSETQDTNYILPYLDTLSVTDLDGNALTPFIVSLGQFWQLIQVFSTYQTAYKEMGLTAPNMKSGGWWSSSQHSDTYMWRMYNGSPSYGSNKASDLTMFPAYAF